MKLLIILLSGICLSCSAMSTTSARRPSSEAINYSMLPVGTKLILQKDIKTEDPFDYVVMAKSLDQFFILKREMWGESGIVAAAERIQLKKDDSLCAFGYNGYNVGKAGFHLKAGTELVIESTLTSVSSSDLFPNGIHSFTINKKYQMICATFQDRRREIPSVYSFSDEFKNWFDVQVAEPLVITEALNTSEKQYFLFHKGFELPTKQRSIGIKDGKYVSMEDVFHPVKACQFSARYPRELIVRAGEMLPIKKVYKEKKWTIIETEKMHLYCRNLVFMIQTPLKFKHVKKESQGLFDIVGLENIP